MELYETDLEALKSVMSHLEGISLIPGLHSVEIRVRIDDVPYWAVIGWGEAGDPCVLRFDKDPAPTPVKNVKEDYKFTINKLTEQAIPVRCSCGDFTFGNKQGTCGPNGCYNRPA